MGNTWGADGPDEEDLEVSLVRAIVSGPPHLHSLAEELAELGIDAFAAQIVGPVADTIPFVKSVKATLGTVFTLRDLLFARKALSFYGGVGSHSQADVDAWRDRLKIEKNAERTGELLLATLDRASTRPKARLVGQVFRAYLDGQCTQSQLHSIIEMIDAAIGSDLEYLVHDWKPDENPSAPGKKSGGSPTDADWRLVRCGLMNSNETRVITYGQPPPDPSEYGQVLRSAVRRSD